MSSNLLHVRQHCVPKNAKLRVHARSLTSVQIVCTHFSDEEFHTLAMICNITLKSAAIRPYEFLKE